MRTKTWFAPEYLFSRSNWTLMDGLWALTGYVIEEQTEKKIADSSLTKDQKLFALECMWRDGIPTNLPEPHFYEDLVFIKICDGERFSLHSMRNNLGIREEIAEALNKFSALKNLFKSTANSTYCQVWLEANKPYHMLSEWDRNYLLGWAIKEKIQTEWLDGATETGVIVFNKGIVFLNDLLTLAFRDSSFQDNIWKVKEVVVEKDYGRQLSKLLRSFHQKGLRPPNASKVLGIWREELPWGIYEVTRRNFRYKLKNGKMSQVVPDNHLDIAIDGRIIWSDR